MLMDRWERFRGVNEWPEVKAVITDKWSRYLPSRFGRIDRLLTSIKVDYDASDGIRRSKTIHYWFAPFSLAVGDEFYIRCSPQDPSRIYVREATQDRLVGASVIPAIVFFIWLRERYR